MIWDKRRERKRSSRPVKQNSELPSLLEWFTEEGRQERAYTKQRAVVYTDMATILGTSIRCPERAASYATATVESSVKCQTVSMMKSCGDKPHSLMMPLVRHAWVLQRQFFRRYSMYSYSRLPVSRCQSVDIQVPWTECTSSKRDNSYYGSTWSFT